MRVNLPETVGGPMHGIAFVFLCFFVYHLKQIYTLNKATILFLCIFSIICDLVFGSESFKAHYPLINQKLLIIIFVFHIYIYIYIPLDIL